MGDVSQRVRVSQLMADLDFERQQCARLAGIADGLAAELREARLPEAVARMAVQIAVTTGTDYAAAVQGVLAATKVIAERDRLAAELAAERAKVQRVEAQLHHAEDNEHMVSGQGFTRPVPGVSIAYVRAALTEVS